MKQLLLLLFCIGCFSFSDAQNLNKEVFLIVEKIEVGNFKDAVKECDDMIKLYPDTALFYYLKGEALSEQIDRITRNEAVYVKASAAFDKALEVDSTYSFALRSAMLLNIYHQKYPKAIAFGESLMRHSKDKDDILTAVLNLGNAYGYIGEFEKSIRIYKLGIKYYPNSPLFHNNIAMTYDEVQDFEKSLEHLYKAIELAPDDLGFKGNLAFVFTRVNKFEKAIQIYDEIIAKEVNPLAYNNRGYAKLKVGKLKEALADINRSIQLYPTNSYAFRNRALVYIAMEKADETCKDLKKANELGFSVSYGKEVNQLLEKHCQ